MARRRALLQRQAARRATHRMLLPRMLTWSSDSGFCPFIVIFTFFMCVFMLTSTPAERVAAAARQREPASLRGSASPRHASTCRPPRRRERRTHR